MLATTYMKTHYEMKMHVEDFLYNNSEGDDFRDLWVAECTYFQLTSFAFTKRISDILS